MGEALFVKRGSCSHCESSDGNAYYDDGHQYCFVCETYTHPITGHAKYPGDMEHSTPPWDAIEKDEYAEPYLEQLIMSDIEEEKAHKKPRGLVGPIQDRGITVETVRKYGVRLEAENGELIKHHYPYHDENGKHVATKIRVVQSKDFFVEGDLKRGQLFGQNLFRAGGKYVTVVEGEIDAMSAYQMLGSRYPVVSVKSASSAMKDCVTAYEWLNSYDMIVFAFDMDGPGQKAASAVIEKLFPSKSKLMSMEFKDSNKFIEHDKQKDFVASWWDAKKYSPPDIVSIDDMWEAVSIPLDPKDSFDYPWAGLNAMTFGQRLGEMVTCTGGTGMGKTYVLKEMTHHVLKTTPHNIGVLFLEESRKETGLGLMSVDASIPFHLPTSQFNDQDLKTAFDNTYGTGRVHAIESFGSNTIEWVVNKITFLARALDCKFIILDHISLLVSDQRNADERRALDEIATKLKTLTVELHIHLCMVSHAKRVAGTPLEEGGQGSVSMLRGTAAIGQLSNMVLCFERNGQAEDVTERHTTTVRVLKNRFSGLTGPACKLLYDRVTCRLSEKEYIEELEEE
jgi:twinkle protein